jgi:hypothetical protein
MIEFRNMLAEAGCVVLLRPSRGDDQMAACGQLGKPGTIQAPMLRVPQQFQMAVGSSTWLRFLLQSGLAVNELHMALVTLYWKWDGMKCACLTACWLLRIQDLKGKQGFKFLTFNDQKGELWLIIIYITRLVPFNFVFEEILGKILWIVSE